VTPASDEPTAQAQAIMERVLKLVTECRVVLRALERPGETGESPSSEAERILYFTLMSAIDAADAKAAEPSRRSWLSRVFQVPEGEPTHALLEHIASLSQGERLWFERGALAGDTVVVAHEALSDTPAFLHARRLVRRFGCTVREAVDLTELFLALDASPAVVALSFA
jgi:hypothetical protein